MIKIGHRGASGYKPENTLAAFQKAIEFGVGMIEFDVHICKTGEVVVIHDEKVNRTTNGRGRVSDKTLEELKKMDAGKGEKIPILDEVLDLVDRRAIINIELKGEKTTEPVYKIIKKSGWSYDNFLISSFDDSRLEEMRRLDRKIKIGLIPKQTRENLLEMIKKLKAYSVHCNYKSRKFLNKKFIDLLHERGVKIFAWTVNKKSDVERLRFLGVDGIFSDYPDII